MSLKLKTIVTCWNEKELAIENEFYVSHLNIYLLIESLVTIIT